MPHKIAGLDLSLAGTAAVVLADDGSVFSMLAYSSVERDFKQPARPGLVLHRATHVKRGDASSDYYRTAGIADVLQKFLRTSLVTRAVVGIEDHAFGAQGAHIYQLGHLHGMVRRDIVSLSCRFVLLNVKEVKRAATGKGNAEKDEMVRAAQAAMNLEGLSQKVCEGLADAYAVARLTFWLARFNSGMAVSAMPGDIAAAATPAKGGASIMQREIIG